MARPAGLEPATLGLEGPMSDRLYQEGYIEAVDLPLAGPVEPQFSGIFGHFLGYQRPRVITDPHNDPRLHRPRVATLDR